MEVGWAGWATRSMREGCSGVGHEKHKGIGPIARRKEGELERHALGWLDDCRGSRPTKWEALGCVPARSRKSCAK